MHWLQFQNSGTIYLPSHYFIVTVVVKFYYKMMNRGVIVGEIDLDKLKTEIEMKKFLLVIVFLSLFLFIGSNVTFAESKWDENDVDPNKVWTIEFNKELLNSSMHLFIYVEDSNGNPVDTVNASVDSTMKKIIVKNSSPYKYGETYYLYVPKLIESKDKIPLKDEVKMKFIIMSNPNNENADTTNKFNNSILDAVIDREESNKTFDIPVDSMISDVEAYLKENYSSIDTPMGSIDFNYRINYSSNWKTFNVSITYEDENNLISTLDKYSLMVALHNEEVKYRYNEEEIKLFEETRGILKVQAKNIYNVMRYVYPNKKIEGTYHDYYYKYPSLGLGYTSIDYLTWRNYYFPGFPSANEILGFYFSENWNYDVNKAYWEYIGRKDK